MMDKSKFACAMSRPQVWNRFLTAAEFARIPRWGNESQLCRVPLTHQFVFFTWIRSTPFRERGQLPFLRTVAKHFHVRR